MANLIFSILTFYFVHSSEFLAPGAKAEINIDGKTMEAPKHAMKTPMRFSFHGCGPMVLLSMLIISRLPAFLNLPVFTAERSYGLTLFLVSLNIFFVHSSEFLALGAKAEINIDGKTMEATKQAMKTPTRFTFEVAAGHVYLLLLKKDCYPRFIRSENYKSILANAINPGNVRRR